MQFQEGSWFRPLLSLSRAEIRDYLNEKKIPFVSDPSNEDLNYSRVQIRKELIPAMERLGFGPIEPKLAQLAEEAEQLKELVLEIIPADTLNQESLPYDLLAKLNPLLAKEALFLFLTGHGLVETHQTQLKQILELIRSGKGGWEVQVKRGKVLGRNREIRVDLSSS